MLANCGDLRVKMDLELLDDLRAIPEVPSCKLQLLVDALCPRLSFGEIHVRAALLPLLLPESNEGGAGGKEAADRLPVCTHGGG